VIQQCYRVIYREAHTLLEELADVMPVTDAQWQRIERMADTGAT
jgi:hypothetical protein